MKTAIIASLVAGAAAFAPAANKPASTQLSASLSELDGGSSLPLPNFDPLKLAEQGSDETLRWYRAAELKHGRCAMVATVGYLTNAAGYHFPGQLSSDVSFESLAAMSPPDAWAAVPIAGKAQILATIFIAELVSEGYQGTHYMKGGEYPTMVFPQIDFSGVSKETMERKRTSELNNGRLAQIAILSFISEHYIPGSVPVLANNPGWH
ncbi:hypothetical protein ACHAWT_007270 [Skeletonema menzelii]|mmetsp:Transcript_20378/g.33558  ORF Transcript_20378/g.33558 Transcript_20378/m.33558 type:complete len:208 (+) Transcript_20378:63-686(+)|eukprot:scaffold103_cov147-Skeletonema_menzelii.AAC.12